MFYKYEIKNNGQEDILYLYLTMAYEFSKELVHNENEEEITRRTKNFIKSNKIDFKGEKVYLVIDGIVVKTLDIKEEKTTTEILKENLYYSNDYYLVTVKLDDDSIIEITLKDYLLGVLATNMVPDLELEALKALCVLYRTYAFFKISTEKFIFASDNYAVYKPISYYKLSWIEKYDEIVNKLREAVVETDCLFLTYNHSYILPFIHFSNSGRTFSQSDYPYLTAVKSLWDLASPYYIEINDYSYDFISKLLKTNVTSTSDFDILDVDYMHFVRRLKISNSFFSGEEFIKLLNLKSLNLSIIVNQNYLRIITKGWGNSLGLSIFGANELAKDGCNFANILKYYFPKVQLNKYIKELS